MSRLIKIELIDTIMGLCALGVNITLLYVLNIPVIVYSLLALIICIQFIHMGRKWFVNLIKKTKTSIVHKYQYQSNTQILWDLNLGKKVFFEGYSKKNHAYRGFLLIENNKVTLNLYDKKQDTFNTEVQSFGNLNIEQSLMFFKDIAKEFQTIYMRDGYLKELKETIRI